MGGMGVLIMKRRVVRAMVGTLGLQETRRTLLRSKSQRVREMSGLCSGRIINRI